LALTTPHNHSYRRDIDGLRGVAILFVVLFHFFPNHFSGGFIGVDVFFVISGFLITSIIRNQLQDQTFTFTEFYSRRIRRLFPALGITLAGSYVIGWFTLGFGDFGLLGKHIASGAGFLSNYTLLQEAGYFDRTAITKPLIHLWSLAIEEQFYLIWPLLLLFALRKAKKLILISWFLLLTSFTLNVYLTQTNSELAYYSPITRFWELLIGAVLSGHRLQAESNKRGFDIVCFISLGAMLVGLFGLSKNSLFPGWWALLPTISTAIIIMLSPNSKYFNQLVSHKLIVSLGLISYPLYLVHWPILSLWVLTHLEPPGTTYSWALVFLSVGIATMIYLLMERPLRKLNLKKTATWLLFIMIIIGYIGYNAYSRDGLPFRPIVENELLKNVEQYLLPPPDAANCALNEKQETPCIAINSDDPKVFFWGDSTTANVTYGLTQSKIKELSIQPVTLMRGACPPITHYEPKTSVSCDQFISHGLDFIDSNDPDVIVLSGNWGGYMYEKEFSPLDLKKIELTITELKKLSRAHIILIGQFPIFDSDQIKLGMRQFVPFQKTHSSWQQKTWMREADNLIRDLANRMGISFVSPIDTLCTLDGCLLSADPDEFVPMAYDSLHMTYPGSSAFVNRVFSHKTFH